jgi:hypothetical protein
VISVYESRLWWPSIGFPRVSRPEQFMERYEPNHRFVSKNLSKRDWETGAYAMKKSEKR